jgi:hypothetical protein
MIELNPLLVEIEQEITRLNPEVKRVSSGRSGLTDRLTGMLWAKPGLRGRGLRGSAACSHSNCRTISGRLALGQRFAGAAGAGFVHQVSKFRRAKNRGSGANRNDLYDASLGSTAGVGYPGNGFLVNLEWRPVLCTLRP